jgi:membrane dipeptidase
MNVPIFDLHQDCLHRILTDRSDFFSDSAGAIDYNKLISGNVIGSLFAIFCEDYAKEKLDFQLSQFKKICDSEKVQCITNANQVNFQNGKIHAILHLEGADPICNEIYTLKELYNLGLRSVGLVWVNSNKIAGGLKDENQGLTDYGVQFVKKCNEMGILIDVSHLNQKSFYDLMKVVIKPVMASHSNCFSINPNIRNITDEQIKLIAKNNGVIGISVNPIFVKDFNGKWIESVEETTTIQEICRHIEHIKNLVGIDYVALGSDFDGGPVPKVISDASHYQEILYYLKKVGYSDEDIRKVAHGNFLRVFKAQMNGSSVFGVDHIALELSNIREGIDFFHNILGLSIKDDFIYNGLRYVKIDAITTEFELFENKNKILTEKPFLPLSSKGFNHIGIKVPNIKIMREIIEKNNVEIIKDIYEIDHKILSFIVLGPDNIEFQFEEYL